MAKHSKTKIEPELARALEARMRELQEARAAADKLRSAITPQPFRFVRDPRVSTLRALELLKPFSLIREEDGEPTGSGRCLLDLRKKLYKQLQELTPDKHNERSLIQGQIRETYTRMKLAREDWEVRSGIRAGSDPTRKTRTAGGAQ